MWIHLLYCAQATYSFGLIFLACIDCSPCHNPGDLVISGMVVGTTYDVSVCEMGKRKMWVKSQNGINRIEWMNGSGWKWKLMQIVAVCWKVESCHMMWCRIGSMVKWSESRQWHVLHPFPNTAELVKVWRIHMRTLSWVPIPCGGYLPSVALAVLPLGGKSCGWSSSMSSGGT